MQKVIFEMSNTVTINDIEDDFNQVLVAVRGKSVVLVKRIGDGEVHAIDVSTINDYWGLDTLECPTFQNWARCLHKHRFEVFRLTDMTEAMKFILKRLNHPI